MKSRLLVVLGVVVLGVVLASVWFLNAPVPQPEIAALTPTSVATPAPTTPVPMATPRPVRATPAPGPQAQPRPAENAPPLAEWEIKISSILESNATETETAQMLINLLPTLPVEGQAEAAQHVTNLITDPDYQRVLPLLRNSALPQEVQDVLFTDLMNRADGIKLPAMLDVARNPAHPYHEEALSDLQIFLNGDFGNNWGQWDSALKDYLRKQAADQAEADAAVPATGMPR